MAADGHTLVIEGVSDATLRALQSLADAHAQPLEAEARDLLSRSVRDAGRRKDQDWPALIANAERIAAMTPPGVVQTNSTALVREDRDDDEPWR
jgi:antitoxin FitA